MQSMSFLYSSSQVSLAMIEELRATIKKQELEMNNLKDHLDKVVCTDLGSLNETLTVCKFKNFSATQILCEINFETF